MASSSGGWITDFGVLAGRVLIAMLFLVFGFDKLTHFADTVAYMRQVDAPVPAIAAVVAVVAELGLAAALIGGAYVRTAAILLAVYTLATAFIGHPYWQMSGMDRYLNQISFYKNLSIIGGLLVLFTTGAGRYSFDAIRRRR